MSPNEPSNNTPTESPPPKPISGAPERGGAAENVPKLVGRVPSLTVFEVTDDELTRLEEGSPDSLMLNLSLTFLGSGVSTLVSLLTTKVESDRVFAGFLLWTFVMLVASITLLILWYARGRNRPKIIKLIRQRGDTGTQL
jgi:hypothetical protein